MEHEFNSRLIDLVSQHTPIWHAGSKDHKNRFLVENAWRNISLHLSKPDEFCQRRWTSLRTQYGRKHKKRREMPSGSAAVLSESWPHYAQMRFLDQVMKHKDSVDNFPVEVEDGLEASMTASDVSSSATAESDGERRQSPAVTSQPVSDDFQTQQRARKRPLSSVERGQIQVEMLKFLKTTSDELNKKRDQFESFGDFVANQLRLTSPDLAKPMMKKITEILFQEY